MDQRAGVRARYAHHRRERLHGAAARRCHHRPHRRDRLRPGLDRAVADLPRHPARSRPGLRRSVRIAAGRAGPSGRAHPGPHVDDRGHAVPVPHHPALRDPVHGLGHRRLRRSHVHDRLSAGSARPLVGGARLVEHGLGVERPASARRHPSARRRHPHTRRTTDRNRLCPAAGRAAGRTPVGHGARKLRRQCPCRRNSLSSQGTST
jgi:hypothetical protein